MRIGIDVRYLSHGLVGGIHTYLTNLLPPLLDITCQHQVVLYADTKRQVELDSVPDHVTIRRLPWRNPLSSMRNDVITMRRQLQRDRINLVHYPANYGFGPGGMKTVTTLQDEINILPLKEIIAGHKKNARTVAMMTYLHFMTKASLRRTDQLITVSEYSKRQIAQYGSIPTDRIHAIPHACPADFTQITDPEILAGVRRKTGITRPFVLADAFKNPAIIVQAWRMLPAELRDTHEIVFFSRSPDVMPAVHEAVELGYATLLIRPSRRDVLSALFSMAEAFVFPSWIEGFGIPLVEAMTCGAPIIASNRGAIPEVVGDAALIMDADDAVTLKEYLACIFTSPSEAARLRAKGFERVSQFSWESVAQRTLETYERALA